MLQVRFKFDVWRHFVFPVSRNKQEGKGDIHKTTQRHCRTTTNAHLWHFFAQIARFQVKLLIHKQQVKRLFFKSLTVLKKITINITLWTCWRDITVLLLYLGIVTC